MSTLEPLLRRSPVPVREPVAARRIAMTTTGSDPVQGGTVMLPFGVPPARPAPGLLPRRAHARIDELVTPPAVEVPAERAVQVYPEPSAWAARFLQATMEVVHGVRPAGQLVRWSTPEVHESIVRRAGLAGRLRSSGATGAVAGLRVQAVRSCRPGPHCCEVAAVLVDRERVRAVAMRLEGMGNRWRVTALQIG